MRVPDELTGFRTIFSAFHHFRPEEARAVVADAAHQRQGIAVGGRWSAWRMLA